MADFVPIETLDYPKAKTTRPHVELHDGNIIKYCFPNAGIWKGYDDRFNRKAVELEDIKRIKYNSWSEWLEWQKQNWDKLYN